MTAATKRPPPEPAPAKGKSGQHPAVQAYRRKLDSITEGAMQQMVDLDTVLESYLESVAPPPQKDSR